MTRSNVNEKNEIYTLSIDCGGGGIKSGIVNNHNELLSDSLRTGITYPFSPADLINIISSHIQQHNFSYDRIVLGFPGMVRGGKVIYTPHYIRFNGPHTQISAELQQRWNGLNLQEFIGQHFNKPILIINDSELAASKVVCGQGTELMLTLGTGLGCSLFVNGSLAPHIEMSHALFSQEQTYDECLGEIARQTLGNSLWNSNVERAIISLWPVFRWDRLYLGGGNSTHLSSSTIKNLEHFIHADDALATLEIVPNISAILGGHKAWELASGQEFI